MSKSDQPVSLNLVTAQDFFVRKLQPYFKEWGFEYTDAYSQFRKTNQDGFQNVIISTSKYEEEIWIEIHLGIRKNLVEQIAQQFLSHRTDFQQQANTITVSLAKLTQNPYFRYKGETKEDLQLCAEQLVEYMDTQGMQFLEQMDSLQELDLAFNHKPKKKSIYTYNQKHRIFKGLILAKVTHHPLFEELINTYYQELDKIKADAKTMHDFKRLIGFLTHYSVN